EPVVLPSNVYIFDAGKLDGSQAQVSGHIIADSTVTITIQGQTYQTQADDRGHWSIDIEQPLTDGDTTVAIKAVTPQGEMYFAYRVEVVGSPEPVPPSAVEREASPVVGDNPASAAAAPSAAAAQPVAANTKLAPGVIDSIEDNVGNYQGELASGDHTDDDIPALTGKVEPGYSVLIYDNGVFLQEVFSNFNDGSWRFSPTTALPEGEHSFTIEVRDLDGNTSARSEPYTITVDRSIAPPSIDHAIDNVGAQTGQLNSGALSDDTSPTLEGQAEPGATVEIFINGQSQATVVADDTGRWQFTPATELADGDYEFSARQTDLAVNNSGPSDIFRLTIDGNKPPVAVADSFQVTGPSDLQVLANDYDPDGDAVSISRLASQAQHGTVSINADGSLRYTPNPGSGQVTDRFSYEISDGNGATAIAEVVVEYLPPLIKPTIDLVDSSDSGWYNDDNLTNDTTPTFSGTASPNSTVDLYQDQVRVGSGVADASGNWTITTDRAINIDGRYNFSARSSLPNSAESASSEPLAVTIDTVVEANVRFPWLQSMGGNFGTARDVRFELSTNELVSYDIRDVAFHFNGRVWKNPGQSITATGQASTNTTIQASYSNYSHGWFTFGVKLQDVAGNNKAYNLREVIVDPIAALEDGGYIVTYLQLSNTEENGFDIMSQRYDINGDKVGGATLVNSTLHNDQTDTDVTGLTDGGYVITWQSDEQDGDDFGIYSQRYDVDGNKVGAETQVNTESNAGQLKPQITSLDDGGYAVVWISEGQDGSGDGIYMRIYNADGSPRTTEMRVNDEMANDQTAPTITTMSNGDMVIAWEGTNSAGELDLYAKVITANGEMLQAALAIDTSAGDQSQAHVTALAGGGFALSWMSSDSQGYLNIMAQTFDASGAPTAEPMVINKDALTGPAKPEIAGLEDGSLVIAWTGLEIDSPDMLNVYMSKYDANGQAIFEEQLVTNGDSMQAEPHLVGLKDGGYLLTWSETHLDSGDAKVWGQRFDANDQGGAAFEVGTVVHGEPNPAAVPPQADDSVEAGEDILLLDDLLTDLGSLDDLLFNLPKPAQASSGETSSSDTHPAFDIAWGDMSWDGLLDNFNWQQLDNIAYMLP
ncbi:MAG: Ig-like domain-containing protein, partial [Cellvibrionaceae bacterium]|nr:Ig-like domain-containing protein [Cellvibrionaceae bacterium]